MKPAAASACALCAALSWWIPLAKSGPVDSRSLEAAGGARISPYWRAERRLVAALHVQGRLGATIRLLRAENRRLRQAAHRAQRKHRRALRRLAATTDHGASYALRLASAAYGVPLGEITAVASCETGGTFDPGAYNESSRSSGLLQFLPSTWANTPYAGFSVFDAVPNALAAGWLWRQDGGWSEWTCRP